MGKITRQQDAMFRRILKPLCRSSFGTGQHCEKQRILRISFGCSREWRQATHSLRARRVPLAGKTMYPKRSARLSRGAHFSYEHKKKLSPNKVRPRTETRRHLRAAIIQRKGLKTTITEAHFGSPTQTPTRLNASRKFRKPQIAK